MKKSESVLKVLNNVFLVCKSKRAIIALILSYLLFYASYAQDLIVTKTGKTIKCKITGVDSVKINFDYERNGKMISTYALREQVSDFSYGQKPVKTPVLSGQDIIYLKNGSVVKGKITEQIPGETLKIQTNDGSVWVFNYAEIDKITQESEEMNLDEYGGHVSFGVAIGGGGLVGCPLRFGGSKFAFEIAPFFRPVIDLTGGELYPSVMFAGGPAFFSDKFYKAHKQKIKRNGFYIKGGYSLATIGHEAMFSMGWVHESFRLTSKRYSFIFELGPGIIRQDDEFFSHSSAKSRWQFALYWKIHWNWYGS
ncbi:MAG: hypothetical protein JW973_11515 [Bacteroidales bacterium]|nr:hypothetical protein [Bacteroidales bacterium]